VKLISLCQLYAQNVFFGVIYGLPQLSILGYERNKKLAAEQPVSHSNLVRCLCDILSGITKTIEGINYCECVVHLTHVHEDVTCERNRPKILYFGQYLLLLITNVVTDICNTQTIVKGHYNAY